MNAVLNTPAPHDGRSDFDFVFGSWIVHNRRLLKALQGSDEWETFEATSVARPLLGGIGNEDEFLSPHRPGFVGMSLRLFDLLARRWSIYWIDNRTGLLQPPVVGRFEGATGVFEGTDVYDGRPIQVRYTWSGVDTTTPRWEQAFSADGGKTWETNWIMDHERIEGTR